MSTSSGFLLSSLCLFIIIVLVKASRDGCEEFSNCGLPYDNRAAVRFPFRLKNRQPSSCGYPGFDLSCTANNETVLQLPDSSIKLYIEYIYYYKQLMSVRIADYYDSSEVRRSLELLNLSTTPFWFTHPFSQFNMMICPQIGCGSLVRLRKAISINGLVNADNFINCSKLYNYSAPYDPADYYSYYYDSISKDITISLTWSIPNCKPCEQQQMECRVKNNGLETECFDPYSSFYPYSSAPQPQYYQEVRRGPIKAIVAAVSTISSVLVLLVAITTLYVFTSDKIERENRLRVEKFLEDYIAFKPSRYSYADVKKITDKFKVKLGEGAYGTVFKGKLSNDISVAVKILANTKGDGSEFINEMATMGQIHHINVARLVGYCADGFRRALVFEFFPNDSLDKYISRGSSKISIGWEKLQDIALGIAKGIHYLHQGCDQRILHFDIKPHNILLDQNFTPKICDFGLAKLCSKDQSIVSMTTTRGTMGYIAPEVFSRNFGNVSYKSDVYSFGMLLLEMVGGRKNTSEKNENVEEIYYPEWIYNLLEEGEDLRIQIEEDDDAKIAKKLAIVGLWCVQWHPIGRPSMKVVVQMLEGREDLTMPPNPFASTSSSTTNKMPTRRIAFELEAIAE